LPDSRDHIYTGEVFSGERAQRLVPGHPARQAARAALAAAV